METFHIYPTLEAKIQQKVREIHAQREEILAAFLAKHGIQPDEAVQVIEYHDGGMSWSVRKKSEGEQ